MMRDMVWTREDEGTPLYLQLARSLREHINSGGIGPGSALPSERDLSEMAGLSRVTIRKGIEQLIEEGVLVRKQGSGTFVARRIETSGGRLSSFTDEARKRGEDPGVIWINKSYAQPTEEEATALQIGNTARVARLGRVRLAGGEPLAIEHAVVPAEFLPELDSLGFALSRAGNAWVSPGLGHAAGEGVPGHADRGGHPLRQAELRGAAHRAHDLGGERAHRGIHPLGLSRRSL
jgi:GntR family transcriptional regulator